MEKKDIFVRENLNDMVKEISIKRIHSKFGDRDVCFVKLFNDEVVEFKDKDGLNDLLHSYDKCGISNAVVSKKLVEELKLDEEGQATGTFVCVAYELVDGAVYRMFVSRFSSLKIIDNYYNLFMRINDVEK